MVLTCFDVLHRYFFAVSEHLNKQHPECPGFSAAFATLPKYFGTLVVTFALHLEVPIISQFHRCVIVILKVHINMRRRDIPVIETFAVDLFQSQQDSCEYMCDVVFIH